MPIDSAAWWSSATARSARPIFVFWKNSASAATSTPAMAAAARSNVEIAMSYVSRKYGSGSSGMPSLISCVSLPHRNGPRPSRKNASPIVAMNSEIGGWLTSGRSTKRSVTMPNTIMIDEREHQRDAERRTLREDADERQRREVHHRALREVEDARRLVDQHEAERDERVHHAREQAADQDLEEELHRQWRRGSHRRDAPPIAHQCTTPRYASITAWLRAHLVRRAVADLAAVVEHDHPVGDVHHDAHVVLDQHDRRAELVVDVEDEAAHVLLLLDVHAGHRLVEQQQRRLGRERARELDALLQSVRQAADRRLADVLDLEEVDHLLDAARDARAPRDATRPTWIASSRKLPRIRVLRPVMMLSSTLMPLNSAMFWNVRAIPSRAARCGLMSRRSVPRNTMRPLLRMVDAVDDVQHRALAGAVRPDDRADLVLADVERDVGQRLHAAERERDAFEREDHVADAATTIAARSVADAGLALQPDRGIVRPHRPARRTSSRPRSRGRPRSCRDGRPRSGPRSR